MIYIYGATTTLLRQNARINKILRAKFIIQQELNLKFGDFSNLLDFQKPTSKFAPKKIPMVIPPITAHWLRHTYITMLYLAGVDVMTAKEQAGHADIKTTMQIYTHLDSKYKNNQIDKLDEYLSKKGNGCQMGVKKTC
jgi:integrase